ncbi:MAG: hypothetical protein HC820_01130, partial [Hydrococcus sp. RM1_1_31]|nr:hypothetical protein [Hydrococcus sp. RM1_1_31]
PTDLTQLLATRKQHKQQAQPEREDAIAQELPQLKSPVTQDTIQKSESSIAYSSNKSKEEPIETLAPILDSDSQKKVGRPRGRRSNPDVDTLNLLIDEDLVAEVRFKLAKLNKGKKPKQTISDLVEELLQQWITEK